MMPSQANLYRCHVKQRVTGPRSQDLFTKRWTILDPIAECKNSKLLLCIFILLELDFGQLQTLTIGKSAHFSLHNYFVLEEMRTYFGVSTDQMF